MDRQSIRKLADCANRETRRKVERLLRYSRFLKQGNTFRTGTGRLYRVVMVDNDRLHIESVRGKSVVSIPLANIKRMFAYFEVVRIVERKELETFHSFNSALFGLLSSVYGNNARIGRIKNLLRLIKQGVRVHLAGGERSPKDLKMAATAGAKHVLFSYFYVKKGRAWKEYLRRYGFRCILDSGAFSEWQARENGKKVDPIKIDEYIAFIKKHSDIIDHYFVLDVVGDNKTTMANQSYMERAGLSPIPVYHLGVPIQELDRLVGAGYPVIALGGTVGQPNRQEFLEMVFNRYPNVAFHGLGITQSSIILNFPFFSVDSKAWVYPRRKDRPMILTKHGQVKRPDLPPVERVKRSVRFLKNLEIAGVFRRRVLVGEQLKILV